MGGISNRFIDQVLTPTSITYRGTYSSDFLPRHNYKHMPASLVINLSRHTEKNGHFVSIYEDKNNLIYFDPLGLHPFIPAICHFIERSGKNVRYNYTPVQSAASEYCGFFAMCFILWCEKVNDNMKDFISMFENNLVNNDSLVIGLLNTIIEI